MLSEGRRRKISSGFKLMKWSPFCNRRLLHLRASNGLYCVQLRVCRCLVQFRFYIYINTGSNV